MENTSPFSRLSLGRKALVLMAYPVIWVLIIITYLFAVLMMNVRNIGRWLDLFGAYMVGSYSDYTDMWNLTVGDMYRTTRDLFKRG